MRYGRTAKTLFIVDVPESQVPAWFNSIGIFRSAMQTSVASVMGVGVHVRVFAREVHLRDDFPDDAPAIQNALISQQTESA